MADSTEPPERRRRENAALRALYVRVEELESEVDTLRKLNGLQEQSLKHIGEHTVSYKALAFSVIGAAVAVIVSAWRFSEAIEDRTSGAIAHAVTAQTSAVSAQASKLDTFMERQAATNVKTEALYLLSVERKPREEVRAVVRQTAKEQ